MFIGTDFPDEFCHSKDKIKLKGGNEKAKANMVSAIGDLIRVATNKAISEDFGKKHKKKACKGWYRYDTRFGIPFYNSEGILERYNIYSARMLVRCDEKGNLFLYDLVRTKKKRAARLNNKLLHGSKLRFFVHIVWKNRIFVNRFKNNP